MSEATLATVPEPGSTELGFSTGSQFDHIQRVAKMFAESQLVPTTFQRNVPNVTIALSMSQRIGCDPLMVMQNLNIIHGKPSFGASFMIATVNSCGRFSPLRFHFVGTEGKDDWGCYATAKAKVDAFECRGITVNMEMAKAEGWLTKSGSKWKTMPQLMLQYRAATFWTRAFAPEILMGFPTQDEVIDVATVPSEPGATPPSSESSAQAAPGSEPPPGTPSRRGKRTDKGVAEMKKTEPVPSEPGATPPPANNEPTSSDSNGSSDGQPAKAAEPAPASTAPAEPSSAAAPATEEKPAAPAAPEPAPAPAPAEAPPAADKLLRCEIVTVADKGAGVSEVQLKGDYTGICYHQKPKDGPGLPSVGAVIDAILVDKPSRRDTTKSLKVLSSFTVIG